MQEVKKQEQMIADKVVDEDIKVELAKLSDSNQWFIQLDDQFSKMNRAINKYVEKFEWPNQELIKTGPYIMKNEEAFDQIKKLIVKPETKPSRFTYFAILM